MKLNLEELYEQYHPIALELIEKDNRSIEEERILDIDRNVREAIWAEGYINPETEKYCFGEFTRRLNNSIKELEKLLDGAA